MADREKVIQGLEICSEHGSWHGLDCELNEAYKDCPYRGCETGCVVTIAKDAIKLLKEQEAMLVLSQRECETFPNHYERKGFCPKCHQVVDWLLNRSYCGLCGQKVKWDENRRMGK